MRDRHQRLRLGGSAIGPLTISEAIAFTIAGASLVLMDAASWSQAATYLMVLLALWLGARWLALRRCPEPAYLRSQMGQALLLRVVISIALFIIFPRLFPDHPVLGNGFMTDDGEWWDSQAVSLLSMWTFRASTLDLLLEPKSGFTTILAAIYGLAGHSLLAVRLFNSVAGALLVGSVYHLGEWTGGPTVARRASRWATLFPLFVLYSAVDVRDIITALMVSVVVLQSARVRQGRLVAPVSITTVILAAMYLMRPQWVPMLGLLFAASALFQFRIYRHPLGWATAAICVTAGMIFVQPTIVGGFNDAGRDIQEYQTLYRSVSEGSAYRVLDSQLGGTGVAAALRLPYSLGLSLLTPFPFWFFRSDAPLLRLEALLNLAWYAILPLFVFGMFASGRFIGAKHITAITLVISSALAFAFFGSAAAGRYRLDVFGLWLVLAAYGMEALKQRGHQPWRLLLGGYAVLAVVALAYEFIGRLA